MELISKVTEWISSHMAYVGIVAGALEVAMRLFPSDKVRSMFSYAGKLFMAVGKLLFMLSDVISKVVPDKKAPEVIKPL